MKSSCAHLLTIFFILVCGNKLSAQSIYLSTQSQVDAWDRSVTVLSDDLYISGDDITNIDSLSNITSIKGVFQIFNCPKLSNLNGLCSLNSVDSSFTVSYTGIQNIDGLKNLTYLKGPLTISYNPQLSNINAFLSLISFEGFIYLNNNDSLSDLNGLRNITNVRGGIYISGNPSLSNLDGLDNIHSISGRLNISRNDSLIDITSLSMLKEVSDLGTLYFADNNLLENVDALCNLKIVDGKLIFDTNPSLVNIDGLKGLTSINGKLIIDNNDKLKHFTTLENLKELGGEIKISSNDSLEMIKGFNEVNMFNGNIELSTNNRLREINFLNALDSISGNIIIKYNDSLMRLDAFAAAKAVSGDITIEWNNQLKTFNGLSQISSITGTIDIDENELEDLNDFSELTNLEGHLFLSRCYAMTDIDFLSELTSIEGGLHIFALDGLTNVNGLAKLNSITGALEIGYSDNLLDLDGLSNLTSLDGRLFIKANYALPNIEGLRNLRSISDFPGYLIVSGLSNLIDVDPLENIREIGNNGQIRIENNPILQNVDGLRNLTSFEGQLYIRHNGSLAQCCGLLPALESDPMSQVIINGNAPGCVTAQEILDADCDRLDAYDFEVFVFNDANESCTLDTGEKGIPYINVNIGDYFIKPTDVQGLVSTVAKSEIYEVSADLRPDFFTSCDNNQLIDITTDGLRVNIPVNIINECTDLSMGISTSVLRRCFDVTYNIDVYNDGFFAAYDVELLLKLDDYFNYVSSNMDLVCQTDNFYEFNLGDIGIREQKRFQITINLSCDAELGQEHYMDGKLIFDNPCSQLRMDPSSFECRENVGSYDPNDKTIYVDGFENKELIGPDSYIEYLIRFQNTGTDTAFTVRIEDELVPGLDKRSLYPFVASHDYSWEIKENKLIVEFSDINLVDSTTNETGSHGFVKFRVAMDDQVLSPGDLVNNEASIFFDFNEPVLTNNTSAYYLCQDSENYAEISICDGTFYYWEATDSIYSMPGQYTTNLESQWGCDSIVYLDLVHLIPNDEEIPYNGLDDDCNSATLDDDLDQDGFFLADDCDDYNPDINPDQTEEPYNGIDDDCNSATLDDDLDQDGFLLFDDCDDNSPNINPDQTEEPYNGINDDCNSATLDDDLDQDGFLLVDDCDDNNPNINPDQTEEPYNGINDDCNSATLDDDLDQDGFLLADDCDDNNPNINPDAEEIANNGIDENCDGMDLVSSTYEIGNSFINIFPNPTTDEININISGNLSFVANLFDLNGKLLITKENSNKINLNTLPTGTYLLEIKDRKTGQKIVEKVIIGQ